MYLLLIFLIFIRSAISTFLYSLSPSDTDFVKPCEGKEDIFILNYFDTSNITKYWNDNDELIVNGRSETKFFIEKDEKITMVGEVQMKKLGIWTSTAFTFHISDICASINDPSPFLRQYINYFDKQERHCPYKPRSNYTLTNGTPNMKIQLPKVPDGQYRIICSFTLKKFKVCATAEYDVARTSEKN